MLPQKRTSTTAYNDEHHESSIREPDSKRRKYDLIYSRSTESEIESAQVVSAEIPDLGLQSVVQSLENSKEDICKPVAQTSEDSIDETASGVAQSLEDSKDDTGKPLPETSDGSKDDAGRSLAKTSKDLKNNIDKPDAQTSKDSKDGTGDSVAQTSADSEDVKDEGNSSATSSTCQFRYSKLYRLLRNDESREMGFRAKSPNATVSVNDHVRFGSKNNSQYISTSSSWGEVVAWSNNKKQYPKYIATIDVAKLEKHGGVKFIDLTDETVRNRLLNDTTSRNRARKYGEVLIIGEIPPSCITDVHCDSFDSDDSNSSYGSGFDDSDWLWI